MTHWRDVLDVPILDVQYEELVASPQEVIAGLLEFCGVPWDDRCLAFHETQSPRPTLSFDQVNKPMYTTSMGRAERFAAHLAPLFDALAAPLT